MVKIPVYRPIEKTPGGRDLYPHQGQGLRKMAGRQTAPYLMEMRLGKTPTLITWAVREIKHQFRALVVTVRAGIRGWSEELDIEGQTWAIARGDKEVREHVARVAKGWVLTNYESLRASPRLLSMPWDLIALDESTKIRSPKAKVTELLCRKCRAPRRAILTGLPDPEGPMDFFCQFYFLHRQFMGIGGTFPDAFYRWRRRYFVNPYDEMLDLMEQKRSKGRLPEDMQDRLMGYIKDVPSEHGWVPKDGTEAAIKEAVHAMSVVQTRDQVGLGGKKVLEVRTVKMNPRQREMQTQLLDEFSCRGADGEMKDTKWTTVRLQWMGRVAGGFDPDGVLISDLKMKELLALLQGELVRDQVLIWFNYNAELEEAGRRIYAAGIPCAEVVGNTKDGDRDVYIDLFQKRKIRVLLMQVRCGQYALTLPEADTAIYYSNAYDGEVRAQSEDRLVHMAKDNPALLIDLVSEGSIDEHVLALLKRKRLGAKYFAEKLFQGVTG